MSVGPVAGVVAGLWLMVAPAVLGYAGTPASDVHRIAGPIAVSLGFIAMWEITRAVRWPNVVVGAAVIAALGFTDHQAASTVVAVVTGAVLVAATPFARKPRHRFAGGWTSLFGSGGNAR